MDERERRRIRKAKRIRKRKIQRMILICGMVLVALGIIGGTAKTVGWTKKQIIALSEKKAEARKVEVKKSKEEAAKKEAAEKEAAMKAALAEREKVFAVTPGKTVGTYEQSEEKIMYLTFDDGPSEITATVLDILDRYNVKATFFVTGAKPEYAYMIKEAYNRGHTIGLHTYSHDYAQVYAAVDAYFADLEAVGQLVKEQIGYVPCFIRFPGGASNSISAKYSQGIMTVLSQEVLNRGYQYYDWNASSGDGRVASTEEIIGLGTSFQDNNIVFLAHDSSNKKTTAEALPTIIEHYQMQGYVFRAIDTKSYVPHHSTSN